MFECSIPSTLRFTLSIDGKAKTELITNYKLLITLASHCSTFVLTDLSVRLCTTCFILVSIVQRALCYRFQNLVGTVFLSFSGCKDSGCGNQIQIYFPLFSNFSQNRRFSRPIRAFLKSSNDKNIKFRPFSGLQNGRLRTFLSRK